MKDKISNIEFGSLLIMMLVATFLGIGVFNSIKIAGVNSYICVLIAFGLGLFFLKIFAWIFNYEKDLAFHEKIKKLFSKKVAGALTIFLLINALMLANIVFFNLTNFISSQFLQQTPALIIGLLFALLIAYLVNEGINNLSRTSVILTIINLTLLLFAILNLFPKFEIDNLKPFLEFGIKKPFLGAIFLLLQNMSCIFFLLCVPKNIIRNNQKTIKYLVWSFSIACIVMFSVIILTLGALGIELAQIYQYPEYIVLKKINFLNFIDRIENILNIQWIFGMFIILSVLFYFINKVTNRKQRKITPFVIAISSLIVSNFLFKNTITFNTYIYKYSIYGRILFALICTFIGIKAKIKSKN